MHERPGIWRTQVRPDNSCRRGVEARIRNSAQGPGRVAPRPWRRGQKEADSVLTHFPCTPLISGRSALPDRVSDLDLTQTSIRASPHRSDNSCGRLLGRPKLAGYPRTDAPQKLALVMCHLRAVSHRISRSPADFHFAVLRPPARSSHAGRHRYRAVVCRQAGSCPLLCVAEQALAGPQPQGLPNTSVSIKFCFMRFGESCCVDLNSPPSCALSFGPPRSSPLSVELLQAVSPASAKRRTSAGC